MYDHPFRHAIFSESHTPKENPHPKIIVKMLLLFAFAGGLAGGLLAMARIVRGEGTVLSKEFIPAHVVHEPEHRYGKYTAPARDIPYPDMWIIHVFNGYTEVSVHVDQSTYDSVSVGDEFPCPCSSPSDTLGKPLAFAPTF